MRPHPDDPYIPAQGVLPGHLYGMDDVIEVTGRSLAQVRQGEGAKNVMILGMETLGKSTALQKLHEIAISQNGHLHTYYYDSWEVSSIIDELDVIFRTRASQPRWLRMILYWAWRVVASSPLKSVQWIVNFITMSPTNQATMVKKMVKFGMNLRETKKGAVIFIDNLHDVSDKELQKLVTALKKNEMERLPIMFVVTGHPDLLERIEVMHVNVGRLAHVHTLGFLGRDDVRKSLEMPAIQHKKVITMDALEMMVDACSGYPHLVQLMGSTVWRIAGTADLTVDHVDEALPLVKEKMEEKYFNTRTKQMNEKDMAVAMALAATPATERTLDNLVERLGGERDEHSKTINRLIKINVLVELEPGLVGFAVPFLEEYLVENNDIQK